MSRGHWFLMVLPLLSAGVACGEEAGWEYRLAKRVSPRLTQVERELERIGHELPDLPEVPVADQGGTGGFASLHVRAEPARKGGYSLEIRTGGTGMIDCVALVPARRYDVHGLEPQFGMPDGFAVDLLDTEGGVVARVAEPGDLWADPVRAGHPFVIRVSPPVEAAGVRISAKKLPPNPEAPGTFVHAWAEVFLFEGGRNLAEGSEVREAGGAASPSPWRWAKGFLVDGQTPLGLPELPAGKHNNVGWVSGGRLKAKDQVSLEIDLGEAGVIDGVRLFPAKRPTADLPSGFGFPKRFTVSVAAGREGGELVAPVLQKQLKMSNPGDNPVLVPMVPFEGRYVKIEATELWKAHEGYPAFFALSEVEVLSGGGNLARGAVVRSSDGRNNPPVASASGYWSVASLCDGFGPVGRLVSRREWLDRLARRLELEQNRHRLRAEADGIVAGWRRLGLTVFGLLGAAGAFVLIALPIRYRMRSRREMERVRERIASDLHDEVGSNLGSIQMFADLAEGRGGQTDELKRIQRIAAETVSAVRDIVWLLRPRGDHRIGTVEHLRETSSIMLERLEWKFTANEDSWQAVLTDEQNRHVFLYFREALHNILRHSGAEHAVVRVDCDGQVFRLMVEDDGCGISKEKQKRKSTLRALRQRVDSLGAAMTVESEEGGGTRLELVVPMGGKNEGGWLRRLRVGAP